ncbi:hypothetical protein PIB30_091266 [Stylosanthes scabra]|uniref:Uncharacterized protein n=1 Tax=Stylosanthes scabra TaxID=79078 RepID=A0ABU6UTT4_9FABA|nr:hypothetical protein [Stylosanthes scabra]
MYLRGFWDSRSNRTCQDGRLEVYVKRPNIRNNCPELVKAGVSGFNELISAPSLSVLGRKVKRWNPQGDQGVAEVVQMQHELSSIYRWVTNDVLGSPSILNQQYLDELKLSGVLFGGGDLERWYRVEATRRGKRVCFLNLDHPTFLNWLWVNEVMFTKFGIWVPFSDFQQRLLLRASVVPS